MRSQPWAQSFNSDTSTTSSDQTKLVTTMENGLKLPPLKPMSQIDCLAPCRIDETANAREREADLSKIRVRQKRIIKHEAKEREFGFGRRKRHMPDYTDGLYPPLSQVPMGTNPVRNIAPKKTHQVYTRNINTTRLIPISQISCLIRKEDENSHVKKTPQDTSKFHNHSDDSTYVKLARSGGQRDLLHYVEAKPPLQRSMDSKYAPSPYGSTLPALKSKSVQDPTWRPSQWAALSPIKKKDDDGSSSIKKENVDETAE